MKLRRVAILFLIAAGALFFLFTRKGLPPEDSSAPKSNPVAATPEENHPAAPWLSPLKPAPTVPNSFRRARDLEMLKRLQSSELARRAKGLQMLKEKWRSLSKLGPDNGNITEQDQLLAKESVGLLMCSEETMELMRFLEENHFTGASMLIDQEVAALFRSERAEEARAMLTNLPVVTPEMRMKSLGKEKDHRLNWSYSAGLGCSEQELAGFREALADPAAAQNALYGHNVTKAATDPEGAVASTLEALKSNGSVTDHMQSLQNVIKNVPADADFERLERLLPPVTGSDSMDPILWGRRELLKKWAAVDAAAAANYVMSVPEKLGPENISVIAGTVVRGDPRAGVAWAQEFPDGPYFDAAVYALIPHIGDGYPAEARELAGRISDPKLREKSLRTIEGKEQRRLRGERKAEDAAAR